jgi:hypothetical protein
MLSTTRPAWRGVEPVDPLFRLRHQGGQLGPARTRRPREIAHDRTDDLVSPDHADAGGEGGLAERGPDHRLGLPGEQATCGQVKPLQQTVDVPGDVPGVVGGEGPAQRDHEQLAQRPDDARRPRQAGQRKGRVIILERSENEPAGRTLSSGFVHNRTVPTRQLRYRWGSPNQRSIRYNAIEERIGKNIAVPVSGAM